MTKSAFALRKESYLCGTTITIRTIHTTRTIHTIRTIRIIRTIHTIRITRTIRITAATTIITAQEDTDRIMDGHTADTDVITADTVNTVGYHPALC